MKIYTITTPVEGMHEPTYDEVLLSGYTAGYESGYTDGQEECRDYSKEYFTIEALEDGQLNVYISCEYSINDGEWETFEEPATLSLSEGDKVRFKGYNYRVFYYMFSGNTMSFQVYGNILSLSYGDDFEDKNICNSYSQIFADCSGLKSAENLILPATTLDTNCYFQMFMGCSSLTKAPALPATTLASGCYMDMFHGCTSLTTAPELPATILSQRCYNSMFYGCSSLTTAPALPAMTMEKTCYQNMFYGCTSLASAPVLPATTLATSCYYGMFRGCTSLAQAPVLPATTLVSSCYFSMFYECTNLNYVKCLATNISAFACLSDWLANVSPTGTFVKAAGVSWPTGSSGIPVGWTVIEE